MKIGDRVLYTAKDLPAGDFYRLEAEAVIFAESSGGYLIRVTKVVFCGSFWILPVGAELKAYAKELTTLPQNQ